MSQARGDQLLQRLEALSQAGRLDELVAAAEQAVQAGSKRMQVHFRLAAACLRTGQYARALEVTLAAARLVPAEPAELVELARRLMYFNQAGCLREVAQRLLARPVWHAGAEADFAALLSMAGEQDLSSRLLDRAVAVAGLGAGALYNRSQMHMYSGRLIEAEADLRRCLRLEPRMAKAHWALSKLPQAAADEADLDAAAALLGQVPPGSQDEAFVRFALFNRQDRMDDVDAAWASLQRGCQVKRGLLSYTTAGSDALFQALRALGGPATTAPAGTVAALTPVFIVGMHRSGTTLLERILGNHSQVAEGGELYDFPAQLRLALGRHFSGSSDAAVAEAADRIDFTGVGRGYLEQVHWRAGGKPILVDKLPSNFLNIGFIRRALPHARIIHMQRDPMDTCFSNLKELFSNACAYSYDQLELADYYAGYRGLMQHWRETMPGFVLDVQYESLARDPRAEAGRVLRFCGLEWEEGCLDVGANTRAVNTASSAQVREPIHQRSIQAWRRYGQQLAPLAARLASRGIPSPAL